MGRRKGGVGGRCEQGEGKEWGGGTDKGEMKEHSYAHTYTSTPTPTPIHSIAHIHRHTLTTYSVYTTSLPIPPTHTHTHIHTHTNLMFKFSTSKFSHVNNTKNQDISCGSLTAKAAAFPVPYTIVFSYASLMHNI